MLCDLNVRVKSSIVFSEFNPEEAVVYNGWTVLAVLNGTNSQPLEIYTRGAGIGGDIGSIVAVTHYAGSFTNGTFYYHNNHRGDVTCVRSGTVTVATYDYKAYGELRSSSGAYTSRYRFSSKEYDASMGLYYYGYRYYRPETGTWLTQDPLKEAGGLNQFKFVRNNPVMLVDPWGLAPEYAGGSDYIADYVNELRGHYPLAPSPFMGPWSTQEGRELKYKTRTYPWRGKCREGDYMGNAGAGKALADVYSPGVAIVVCVVAEVTFDIADSHRSNHLVKDAIGSFAANAHGIGVSVLEDPFWWNPVLSQVRKQSANAAGWIYHTDNNPFPE